MTIVLSSILGQARSVFGPFGQVIGSELGALLGAQLDSAMFGLDDKQKITYGARLKNLQVQTSAYGRTIPTIYGTARVRGILSGRSHLRKKLLLLKVNQEEEQMSHTTTTQHSQLPSAQEK
ncbi:MAG: hypothetical protein PG981_000129 [Wolbachia endosymbiont of Ctenocephalides orientis wCori]|nr:MAG: hypothetical protein PG981_000129 [Wolbachia endosymbiont of Ctenocephalides orientis wCori]